MEFFLIHHGGPFFAHKDLGSWSIPKGEYENSENVLDAARREFQEETGFDLPINEFIPLVPLKTGNKMISIWAAEGDADPAKLKSNTFKIWGKEFPEADRGKWFSAEEAKKKISPGQVAFIEELIEILEG